jgi:predicted GIY-YIG superfamily endonuclease
MWKVYVLLLDTAEKTYVGATVDIDRRLRQHNSELAGGARYTTSQSSGGIHKWTRVCYVEGFRTKQEALQFEWALKYHSRKISTKHYSSPLKRRLFALQMLSTEEKWTHLSVHTEQPLPEL